MTKRDSTAAERNVAGFPAPSRVALRARPSAAPVAGYVPGYFSEPMRRGFPPRFVPSITDAEIASDATKRRLQERSTAAAEAKLGHAGLDLGLPGSLRDGPVGRMSP